MSKKKIIIFIVLIILLLSVLIIFLINKNTNDVAIKTSVKHDVAEKLYEAVATDECASINISKKTNTQHMEDEVLLYLIFGQMKKDNVLKNSVALADYYQSAEKIIGQINVPDKIENYIYDGYIYNLVGNEITREKYNCGSKKYVSKLYGYTSSENEIRLDVKVGYILDGNVYDINDKLLGEYKSDTLNKLLDKSTKEVYTYHKENGHYILESIALK